MGRSSVAAILFGLVLIAIAGAGWAGETRPCTWENAQPLNLRSVERSEGALRGRCVRLHAELDGWRLSAIQRGPGALGTEYFIGAYAHDELSLRSYVARPRRVEVLGVVGQCSDICANSPETDAEGNTVFCMPAGYCHYYYADPYVMIEAVR